MTEYASILIPSTLLIGGGSIEQAGSLAVRLGLQRPLVVADPFLAKHGLLCALLASLNQAGIKAHILFEDIVPDPSSTTIEALAHAVKSGMHDGLIAIGGGSALDSAKAAAVIAMQGGRIQDYKVPRVVVGQALPVIAIPTTAGTGAEVTRVCVITDVETDEKMLCGGPAFLPSAAIIDYELTLSCPLRLTADTALDSLTHALEAYVSRKANPFTDGLAAQAMHAIWHNIRPVCSDLTNRAGRAALMLAATQAGIAFSNASVALVHGMSRPLGAFFHIPHGLSNAMLLPLVTAFSARAAQARYAQCARIIGLADANTPDAVALQALLDGLYVLNQSLDVPTLRAYAPQAYQLDAARYHALIPTMAQQALASGSPANNPRIPKQQEIEQLYALAWDGQPLPFELRAISSQMASFDG
jgi:alcohol dehydrogenase class IV